MRDLLHQDAVERPRSENENAQGTSGRATRRGSPQVGRDQGAPRSGGNPLPAVADISVTNVCNAACDFCGFSREKQLIGPRRYLDPIAFSQSLPILRRRGLRYLTFQGGEPLVHPEIATLVGSATQAEMRCGLITNGWFLSRSIEPLAQSGLRRLLISIDSADMARHEKHRGLPGLEARIRDGITRARRLKLPVIASVTVSRLVDYEALPNTLRGLGFDAVSFSYPRRAPLTSSSLVYDEHSKLMALMAFIVDMGRIRSLQR